MNRSAQQFPCEAQRAEGDHEGESQGSKPKLNNTCLPEENPHGSLGNICVWVLRKAHESCMRAQYCTVVQIGSGGLIVSCNMSR